MSTLMDNQEYGTIRTHQERDYPHRIPGTQLKNPDFVLIHLIVEQRVKAY